MNPMISPAGTGIFLFIFWGYKLAWQTGCLFTLKMQTDYCSSESASALSWHGPRTSSAQGTPLWGWVPPRAFGSRGAPRGRSQTLMVRGCEFVCAVSPQKEWSRSSPNVHFSILALHYNWTMQMKKADRGNSIWTYLALLVSSTCANKSQWLQVTTKWYTCAKSFYFSGSSTDKTFGPLFLLTRDCLEFIK